MLQKTISRKEVELAQLKKEFAERHVGKSDKMYLIGSKPEIVHLVKRINKLREELGHE